MNEAEKANQESDVFLQQAILINYKSILKVEIDFKPGLNIIIGNNGSGKTNFLDYLNIVLDFSFEKITGYNAEFTIVGKREYKFTVRDSLFNWLIPKNSTQKKSTRIQLYVQDEFKEYDNANDPRFIFEKNIINYESYFLKYGNPQKQQIVNEPASITYTFNESNRQISEFTDENIFSLSIYSEIIFQLTQLTNFNDENIKSCISLLNRFFKSVSDDLAIYTDIKKIRISPNFNIYFSNENKKVDIKNLYIEFFLNNTWVPYDNLSDGTKRLFYVISEITSYFQSEIFDKLSNIKKRIILLEEPELGIHPHQLHKLMLFIKEQSKDKQIILTTHSPQVLNILEADELDRIIICSYDQQEGTQLNHLTERQIKKGQMYMQDEGFLSDYWVYSDLEPAD